MPYIIPADRQRLDPLIHALVDEIVMIEDEHGNSHDFAGPLNYAMTKLALELVPEDRYWAHALTYGVLTTMAAEYYRKYIAPYEDEALKTNGPVQIRNPLSSR